MTPRLDLDPKAIAVLPLANFSPDPDHAYFAAGIHDEILTRLAQISALRVISRTAVLQYEGSTKTTRVIGQELNVGSILEGSVRYAENRVRIVVQLINAADDSHLWAQTYERDLKDIFAIQTDVALSISNALQAELSEEEEGRIESVPTENMAAYRLFLKVRERQRAAGNYADLDPDGWIELGIRDMERAIELDPDFALGYAELSFLVMKKVEVSDVEAIPDLVEQAERAALRAVALDPGLARAYDRLAQVTWMRRDFRQAEKYFKQAFAHNAEARTYFNFGHMLALLGRFEEAWVAFRQAKAIEPGYLNDPEITALNLARKYEAALVALEDLKTLGGAEEFYFSNRAIALFGLKRTEEAGALAVKWAELGGDSIVDTGLMVMVLMKSGHETEARALMERTGRGVMCSALVNGDFDTVFGILDSWMKSNALIEPFINYEFFDPLREDPRYARVEEYLRAAQ